MNFAANLLLSASACCLAACSKTETPSPPPIVDATLTASEVQTLLKEARGALENANFGQAIQLVAKVTRSEPTNAEAHYLSAEARSMSGDIPGALTSLEQAMKHGMRDIERVIKDERLNAARTSVDFPPLIGRYSNSATATVTATDIKAGNISIKSDGDSQTIKVGDITITVPNDDDDTKGSTKK